LQLVVEDGTAKSGKSDYFTIAGKTGTAQKYDPTIRACLLYTSTLGLRDSFLFLTQNLQLLYLQMSLSQNFRVNK
jgi:Penicillin binding protein transpeptidase domain.